MDFLAITFNVQEYFGYAMSGRYSFIAIEVL